MDTDTVIGFLVSSGLMVAILALAMSALRYLKLFLDAKIAELLAKQKSEAITAAVAKANDAIWTVVMQLAQETVDNLKEKALDGKLTPDEITMLRDTAYARSIELMGQQTYGLLNAYAEDVRAWIYTKIDALSRETKL
jgi:endonuclease/exonuclease/phosphatase (EEP) superfamily protein YafD